MTDYNEQTVKRFKDCFQQYGVDAKSLGWTRGKELLRFFALTHQLNFSAHRSILDIGCGFGDLNHFLALMGIEDYAYLGVDIVDDFILQAKQKYENERIRFLVGDVLRDELYQDRFDYVFANGLFNHRSLETVGGYDYIARMMQKALDSCNIAFAFSFISDKVDFRSDALFYTKPEKVLEMAYSLSRNVVLSNAFLPFEYFVTVFRDDTFNNDYGEGNGGYFHLLRTGYYPELLERGIIV